MGKQKQYYVFARPDAMKDHKFTDDVALCKASSFRQAKKIFSQYYADIQDEEIRCLALTKDLKKAQRPEFWILTDY